MAIPFRILDNRPVYLDQLGRPVREGELRFYEAETLDPKDVYSDPDLAVSNGPVVALDSAGRTSVDTWGDGAYRVRLYDVDGVLISEADNVQVPGGATAAIPALEAGKFLTNDGALLLWDDVRQVPDPTGQNGKVLQSDGTNAIWAAMATVVANAEIEFVPGGFKLSDGTTAVLVQFGTVTVGASGSSTAGASFSFATPFSGTPVIVPVVNNRPNPGGGITAVMIESPGAAGATMGLDSNGFINIVTPVACGYIAVGPVAP